MNGMDVPTDDSALYLFGPELYCGWCLESFTCPVRLKIHFHVEHVATCSCGIKFCDKRSLIKHIVNSGCSLPAPFHWSHFVTLPRSHHHDVNQIHITDTSDEKEENEKPHLIEERGLSSGKASDVCDESAENNTTAEIQKQNSKLIRNHKQAFVLKKYCCKLCPYSSNHAPNVRRHILAGHKSHIVAFRQKNSSYPPFAGIFYELSRASKVRMFCCTLCSYSSSSKYRANMMHHVLRKHKNVRASWFNCFTDTNQKSPAASARAETVHGNNDQDLYDDSKNMESANVAAAGAVGSNILNEKISAPGEDKKLMCAKDDFGLKQPCENHRISDIQFIVSSFSSSAGSKELYCDLCSEEFAQWEQAAVHIYVEHCSALLQWRQAQAESDVSGGQPLADTVDGKQSSDDGQNEQLKDSCSMEHDVTAFSGDAHTKATEVSMSVDEDHNSTSDFAAEDASNSQRLENRVKPTLTADESKLLMSSLCRLLNCCPVTCKSEAVEKEAATVHNAAAEDALPHVSQQFTSILESKSMKGAASESARNKAVTFKCKYCQRVCSSRCNCLKHEASCLVRHSTLASRSGIILQIRGTDIHYCSRCGFSDSDPVVVSAHLEKPDVHGGCTKLPVKKLNVKPEPGHDFIGSMKTPDGAYKCSFCSVNQPWRSKMLQHLYTHSTVAFPDEKPITVPHKAAAVVGEVVRKKHAGGSCSRSCPKCCRSFPSIIAYLRHRAVCQAERRNRYRCNLIFYCHQRADGRWQCKMCEFTAKHAYNVYKHIRAKHKEVEAVKREAEAAKPYIKDVCTQTADGRWKCTLCKRCINHRSDLYKHVRAKHAGDINPSLESPKLKTLKGFCRKATNGMWHCKSCTCCRTTQLELFKHIRTAHRELVEAAVPSSSPAPLATPVSVPPAFVRKKIDTKSGFLGERLKSHGGHFVRSCPKCHRKFFNRSVYRSHMRACGMQYLYGFIEKLSGGKAKCLICSQIYSARGHCALHIRKTHLRTGALASTSDLTDTVPDIKTEKTVV